MKGNARQALGIVAENVGLRYAPPNLRADANGNITSYTYDKFDRLSWVTQPGNAVTSYGYDSQGHLISVTDAQGAITMYDYDDLGRLVETDSPDTGTTLYSYDAASNLRYKIQNGQTIEYRYDAANRLTQILYADAALNVSLTYDSCGGDNLIGRVASMSDPSGTTSYSYDEDGHLISQSRSLAGISYTTAYAYDAAGNLRQMVCPGGQTIDYVPDSIDPARIAMVKLNTTQTLASNLIYQPLGPISSMSLGNGIATTKTFDKNYQVKTISAGSVLSRAYTPDNVGNITAIADNLDANRSQSFGYDANYRLTNATGKYGTIAYTYDAVGNRLTQSVNGVQDAYAYYPGTNRLRAITGAHPELFQYDEDGNTTRRIPGAANTQAPIADPADYAYANSGQRSKKDNSADVIYHYDQSGQLIAETTPAGGLIRAYVWLEGLPLAMIGSGGSIYYFHNDHLGTPQRMTDSTGTIVWSADYLPFGKADVTVQTVENNLRFSGQYYDSETGLHYNWNRYYDPSLGRYLRADPIGLTGGVNLFSYVENNPVIYVDPSGLMKPLPPNRTRRRDCNSDEMRACKSQCGRNGVESCKISQTWQVIEGRKVITAWGWVDGPMSCSCNDPDEICGETCKQVLVGIGTGAMAVLIYICTGGPLNPAYN